MKYKNAFLLTTIILNAFYVLACEGDLYLNKMNNLFEINHTQLEYLRNLDYDKIDIYSIKFEYATEFMTFLISKTKIGKSTIYIEVLPTHYKIFEEINNHSLLEIFLNKYFQKDNILERNNNIFFDMDLPIENEIWSWRRDCTSIYYINNFYDPSINRLINMVIIPYQATQERAQG